MRRFRADLNASFIFAQTFVKDHEGEVRILSDSMSVLQKSPATTSQSTRRLLSRELHAKQLRAALGIVLPKNWTGELEGD